MRWIWLVILTFGFVESTAQKEVTSIKLMSYNIRLDHEGDKEDNWHHRKSDMVTYLEEVASDFIGLQEALGHQLEYLVDHLDNYDYVGVGRDDGDNQGEYSPILYDTTKWKVSETNTFWLSATPFRVSMGWDAVCKRVCTYGVFQRKDGNEMLLVLNTHFDHVGTVARRESIRLINQFIHQFDPKLPVVLMGDFNFTPDDNNYQDLTEYLMDGNDGQQKNNPPSATYNGWKSDEEATRRIDYILHNAEVMMKNYLVDHPKTQKHRQLSDHYPVRIEISTP